MLFVFAEKLNLAICFKIEPPPRHSIVKSIVFIEIYRPRVTVVYTVRLKVSVDALLDSLKGDMAWECMRFLARPNLLQRRAVIKGGSGRHRRCGGAGVT